MMLHIFIVLCGFCWFTVGQKTFNFEECHEKNYEERMPLSIDNFISLVEKYESDSNADASMIAEAILLRYRINGVVYCPKDIGKDWNLNQRFEVAKQDLDDKMLQLRQDVPEDLYLPREECSLHLMTSHSTDIYPHAGVDEVWKVGDSNWNYSEKKRKKRSVIGCLGKNHPANHPIEMGVVQTNAGPVALGILLAGIKAMENFDKTYTVDELLDGDLNYMDDDIKSQPINAFYGTTISGEIGQASVLLHSITRNEDEFEVGPDGKFGNFTCCPRLFSLSQPKYSFISRAELFASLDVLIIRKALDLYGSRDEVKLSEIIRMYYGGHGLFDSRVKSCNRIRLANNILEKEEIMINAVNYMYAYQDNFPEYRYYLNGRELEEVQDSFQNVAENVYGEIKTFLRTYTKEDGYYECEKHAEGEWYETQADLLIVYSPQDDIEETEIEIEYITHTARNIGVGPKRSQVAVIDIGYTKWLTTFEKSESDIPFPPFNPSVDPRVPNVADWSCQLMEDLRKSGNSVQDFEQVMDELEAFYTLYYEKLRRDEEYKGVKSQVVLWNLPKTLRGSREDMREIWNHFNNTFPDVSFIFAGSSAEPINRFLGNNENYFNFNDVFVSTTGKSAEDITMEIVPKIRKAPRMFLFPKCNETEDNNDEGSHVYTTFISPNRTTLIRIPPTNFHYSEELILKVEGNDFDICISRTSEMPSKQSRWDTSCSSEGNELTFTYEELCHSRYVNECLPIYISATAHSKNTYCSDDDCILPNEYEFTLTHEGMTCGSTWISPAISSLILSLLFALIVKL